MRKNSGYIVSWANKAGIIQKGIVTHSEQVKAFSQYNKLFIKLCNDDLSVKVDEHNMRIVTLKQVETVKIIGFID